MSRSLAIAGFAAMAMASCAGGNDGSDENSSDAIVAQPASCQPNEQLCDVACVDVSSNARHCGACGVACAPGAVCQAGACHDGCGAGLGFCSGQCVSLDSPANCGTCGNACLAGQFCVAGACSATCAGTVCPGISGSECVSLSDDRNHCGACGNACPPNNICMGGQCVLDCGALTACDGACVDVSSDDAHCGACGTTCSDGKSCMQGTCSCSNGLQACGDACIDMASDPEHCGACDKACVGGGACQDGKCSGGPDGCTDTPASGIALSGVDVYQTVQIPILKQGMAIASTARNADVVSGRRTLFSVHVTPGAGWMPHDVSARIELTDVDAPAPDQKKLFFARLAPMAASTDADPKSSFQVIAPPEEITTNTRYAVSLVECDGAAMGSSGTAGMEARFPATGYQQLEAVDTGVLKVHIFPIGSPGPDVSDAMLKVFKDRLEAVYPITEVIFTVGDPLQASASSMCDILGAISARRSQDNPPVDVYYYGLTAGTVGGESGCSNANSSASGSKTSAGWAQGFMPDDGETGAGTMCHELGHAHGRQHAPCNVQDPDPNYPYPDADTGVWGYDFRSNEFKDPMHKDMMSYCPEPRPAAWVSDYNYQAILERVIAVNALTEIPAPYAEPNIAKVAWRLLVSDSAGLHWVEEPLLVQGTPEGTPMRAVIYGQSGPMQQVEVYKQDLHDGVSDDAFMLTLPEPDTSWREIEVPGLLAPLPVPPAAAL